MRKSLKLNLEEKEIDRRRLKSYGFPENIRSEFPHPLEPDEIDTLINIFHLTGEQVRPYLKKNTWSFFDGRDIGYLASEGINPDLAYDFNQFMDYSFGGAEIVALVKAGLSPEETFEYDGDYGGMAIASFKIFGLGPKTHVAILNPIKRAIWNIAEVTDVRFTIPHYLGKNSVCFFDPVKNKIYKAAPNLKDEIKLLEKISSSKYLVNLESVVDDEHGIDVLSFEYIKGPTLDEFIKKNGKLKSHKVIKYGNDILNGLLDLQKYGIYHHCDIRVANLILDTEKDIVKILDLGIAKTDRFAIIEYTSATYGSPRGKKPNDIISLSQVLYFLATSQHLFTESKSNTSTQIRFDIQDERERVYNSPLNEKGIPIELLPYLDKVDRDIHGTPEDDKLAFLIKEGLKSKLYPLIYMKRLFESD
jgi:serine/threonine protein kinase